MVSNVEGGYRTVAGRGEAAFTVRRSAFVGHVAPAGSIDAAEEFVEDVRDAYDDATHNVPAYRVRVGDSTSPGSVKRPSERRPRDTTLGSGMVREYSSDDGEPSGSAGKPTLNVLQGQELENVVCVVTRYYGGTNLGIGGLARAYSRATKEAVADAGVTEAAPHERSTVVTTYDDSGTVRAVLESEAVAFEAEYDERVSFDLEVSAADAEALYDRLRSATSGRVRIERG